MSYLETIKQRRSIRKLGNEVSVSDDELKKIIETATKETPTSYNQQTQRLVILLDQANKTYWELATEQNPGLFKVYDGFKDAKGTILFFEDQDSVANMQETRKISEETARLFSYQNSAMTTLNVWNALVDAGLAATWQHPLVELDEGNKEQWKIQEHWGEPLGALVFGSAEEAPGPRTEISDEKIFHYSY